MAQALHSAISVRFIYASIVARWDSCHGKNYAYILLPIFLHFKKNIKIGRALNTPPPLNAPLVTYVQNPF